jgi:hypothetical protein
MDRTVVGDLELVMKGTKGLVRWGVVGVPRTGRCREEGEVGGWGEVHVRVGDRITCQVNCRERLGRGATVLDVQRPNGETRKNDMAAVWAAEVSGRGLVAEVSLSNQARLPGGGGVAKEGRPT